MKRIIVVTGERGQALQESPDDTAPSTSKTLRQWLLTAFKNKLKDTRLNLFAPLCINYDKNIGRQVILTNSGYSEATRLESFSISPSPQTQLVSSHGIIASPASAS